MPAEMVYNFYKVQLKNGKVLEFWANNILMMYSQRAAVIQGPCNSPYMEYINLDEIVYISKIYSEYSKEQIRDINKNENWLYF